MGYLIFTPDPQGAQGAPRGIPRGQGHSKIFLPNQQMLLIDVVTYASVMTKMCSASSRDPPGALGGPKRAQGGHTKSRSNEKMLLINFVAYASVMTKMHLGSPLIP